MEIAEREDGMSDKEKASELVEKLISLRFGYTGTYEAATILLTAALNEAYARGVEDQKNMHTADYRLLNQPKASTTP